MEYSQLVLRNAGYISPAAQERIRKTRVLVAGCGIGSTFAETAIRMGYENIVLVDDDTISEHNLNRQNFTNEDIGTNKVDAIAKRMRAINPNANIKPVCAKVTVENAEDLVKDVDLIFDTIDFLDLSGLMSLHDACNKHNKALITAINAGYGAAGFYFPAKNKKSTLRDLFGLPAEGSLEDFSYGEIYGAFVAKIAPHLDPMVVEQFFKIIKLLSEGKPCPAPQVAPGASCVAALAGTAAARIAEGLPVTEAPDMLLINMSELTSRKVLY